MAQKLGWADPGSPETLAATWTAELDRNCVSRAALIASIPGDEDSVAEAVRLYPHRFVGFFMFNPLAPDASERLDRALSSLNMRCVCLFPAMHKYRLDDQRVEKVFEAAEKHQAAVFVHCGVLTVGVRKKLGLPSPFDLRLGDPSRGAPRRRSPARLPRRSPEERLAARPSARGERELDQRRAPSNTIRLRSSQSAES